MILTFEEKYSQLLLEIKNRFSPSKISPKYLRHYICDFIELYAILHKEKVTKSEIIDLFGLSDLNLAEVDRESISGLTPAEIDEKIENEVNILFVCIEYRKSLISTKYPFDISGNSIKLLDNLSYEQKAYISFLFSSNLSIFNEFSTDLTSEFEYLVYCAAKVFFPVQTIIKQFGKNSDYTGTAQAKIRSLAQDMNVKTRDEEINKVNGNQEKGLDIIAWIPFSDKDTNMLIYLFQCACGDGWIKKFNEAKRYCAYYDLYKLSPQSIMAMSYGLNMMGEFEKSDDMVSGDSLFFDRLRIMEYIPEECPQYETLNSFALIDQLISTQNIDLNL